MSSAFVSKEVKALASASGRWGVEQRGPAVRGLALLALRPLTASVRQQGEGFMGTQAPVEPRPAATPKPRMSRFFLWGLCGFAVLILVIVVIPLYATVGARATLAKAQADVQSLASAVEQYQGHMGVRQATLTELTSRATNARGQGAAPFVASIPAPSPGFSDYRYDRHADGRWSITTSGKDACGRAQTVETTAGSAGVPNHFVNCPEQFWWRLLFPDGK